MLEINISKLAQVPLSFLILWFPQLALSFGPGTCFNRHVAHRHPRLTIWQRQFRRPALLRRKKACLHGHVLEDISTFNFKEWWKLISLFVLMSGKLGLHLLHVKMTRTLHDNVSCFPLSSLIRPWILTSCKIQLHIQCHQLCQWFRWCGGSRPVRRQVCWTSFSHMFRPWKWLPRSASQKLWSALAY